MVFMAVIYYKKVSSKSIHFSKPFKQDHVYRMTVHPRLFIQTPILIAQDPLTENGETVSKVTFTVPPEFEEWVRSIEKHVVAYAKSNKEELFHATDISDDLIEASFASSLSKNNTLTLRTSKDMIVYCDQDPVSPSEVTKGRKVAAIISPTFVDFGKKNFACRWSLFAVRIADSNKDCKIVDDE